MWWSSVKICKFWTRINNRVEEITKVKLPVNPRIMLLLDCECVRVVMFKEILAHMLTAATLLTAKHWKSEEVTIREWIEKVKDMCLVNKLTAIIKYRTGNINT